MAVSKLRIAVDANITRSGAQTIQSVALVPAAAEVAAFSITSAADAGGGNVLVTLGNLDGTTTTYVVPVAANDSAVVVAGKIANLAGGYAGWTATQRASPNNHIADLIATLSGVRPDASYSPSTGGAAGTVSTTTQGVAGDVVGVFAQASGVNNGIYRVQTGTWTRHPDYDTAAEFLPRDPSTEWMIDDGKYRGWRWRFANENAPTALDTDILNFVPYLRPEVEEAGFGVEEEGGVFSLSDSGVTGDTYSGLVTLGVNSKGIVTQASVAHGSKTLIRGFVPRWDSGTAFTILPGEVWVPGIARLSEMPLEKADAWSPLAGQNRWAFLFWNGRASFVSLQTVPGGGNSPSAPYAGYARVLGSDPPHYDLRYIGVMRIGPDGKILAFTVEGDGNNPIVSYLEVTTNAPFRVLAGGVATATTTVSLAAVVPPTSRRAFVRMQNTSDQTCRLSNSDVAVNVRFVPASTTLGLWMPLNAAQELQYSLAAAPTSGSVNIDVLEYEERR